MLKKEICAGIVTFNPDIKRLKNCINAIADQVDGILLLDNASSNLNDIKRIQCENEKLYFIENEENKGLAIALNQLCEKAIDLDYQWILTLDQDSICISGLIRSYCAISKGSDVGMISCHASFDDRILSMRPKDKIKIIDTERCITAGTLMNLHAWDVIGHFDEKLFIEWIDYDICMAMKLAGYKIKQIDMTGVYQIGGEEKHINFLFLRNITFSSYSPLRRYYQMRNCIYYVKKYRGNIDRIWILRNIWFYLKIVLLYEDHKAKKLFAMLRGVKDGIKL